MIVMPEIALLPDMSGVCSKGGTLVIISKPTKTASMKMVSSGMKPSILFAVAPFATAPGYDPGRVSCCMIELTESSRRPAVALVLASGLRCHHVRSMCLV